jgi:hypothetical protein
VSDGGVTAEVTPLCVRDGVATRLKCSECQEPICPACFVRTPVGLRCPDCAAASGPPVRAAAARPPWLVPVVVAAVLAVAVAGAVNLGRGGGSDEPALSLGEPAARTPAAERVRLGAGDLEFGRWVLEGRRTPDAICGTLSLEPSSTPGTERCHPLPRDEALVSPVTIRIRTRNETLFLTHGPVSEGTAKVRVSAEGLPPSEVPALGAGMGLGGRFFVVLTNTSRVTFTTLAADGGELGRSNLVPPPGS